MADFSTRGDPPTEFERTLIATADTSRMSDVTALWCALAKRIGIEDLCEVLDEFGGAKVYVISREELFQQLWRPHRDAAIRKMRAAGEPYATIGVAFGLSRPQVHSICSSEGEGER